MSKIAVFGNGESRIGIEIQKFKPEFVTIGCNAIYRDFDVDHLVCCDRRMIAEATEDPKTKEMFIYVREEHYRHFRKVKKNKKIQLLPDLPYKGDRRQDVPTHWGSGPYAVLIACLQDPEEIHLYGFDLYGRDLYINNVYKGTKNYKSSTSNSVDPSYWIYQIGKLINLYPNIKFKIYNKKEWDIPSQWVNKNVEKKLLSCITTKYPL
jgi:hypothetical protein